MIPDHANPHYPPEKIEQPDQFSCKGCSFKHTGDHARVFAQDQWWCPACKAFNPGTRVMRGNHS